MFNGSVVGKAFGVAVNVAIQHQIADEDDFGGREAVDQIEQAGGHRRIVWDETFAL